LNLEQPLGACGLKPLIMQLPSDAIKIPTKEDGMLLIHKKRLIFYS